MKEDFPHKVGPFTDKDHLRVSLEGQSSPLDRRAVN